MRIYHDCSILLALGKQKQKKNRVSSTSDPTD